MSSNRGLAQQKLFAPDTHSLMTRLRKFVTPPAHQLRFSSRQVLSAVSIFSLLAAAACGSSGPGGQGTPGAGSVSGGDGDGDGGTSGVGGSNPGDGDTGGGAGTGMPGVDVPGLVPLYDATTVLEPDVLEDTPAALITRLGDRGRDRHAREDNFIAYDHYLKMYWEHRTASIEIIDTVGKVPPGEGTITFNVISQFKLEDLQAELRLFYRGIGTVAEYHNNGVMTPNDDLHYTRVIKEHGVTHEPLQVGDHMEFEMSQFLDKAVEAFGGRANYYGTTYLYIVGEGLVPWQADIKWTDFTNDQTIAQSTQGPFEGEFSYPIPEEGWLGGRGTLMYQYSNEPRHHFMQMAGNLSGMNAQPFVLGRRAIHTDFEDGHHNEDPANPYWTEQAGKLGPLYINRSCDSCHTQNTRSLPPNVGEAFKQYVFKVGDAEGNPHAQLGSVFQPGDAIGAAEGVVKLSAWADEGGLRKPQYAFEGATPENFSARAAPQLVGMGLLEAIPESFILAAADPDDADGNGISGRVRVITDPVTGDLRLGRFGWKSGQATVKYQIAGALNTDMGVMTSVFPTPDCGSGQQNCGDAAGAEFADADLDNLVKYISLLGIRARRDLEDPSALKGEELFDTAGCASCHTPTVQTSEFHPFGELRGQTIHPFTDLLLHDMGPGLADTLAEGDATGAEWRTPPLWNIGLTADVNAGEAYLHDGRARTLDEAIRWHGGEGEASKNAYTGLSADDQAAIIAFLKSL
jgi:CxxC motif-containing protein (DUF1111 family)